MKNGKKTLEITYKWSDKDNDWKIYGTPIYYYSDGTKNAIKDVKVETVETIKFIQHGKIHIGSRGKIYDLSGAKVITE